LFKCTRESYAESFIKGLASDESFGFQGKTLLKITADRLSVYWDLEGYEILDL